MRKTFIFFCLLLMCLKSQAEEPWSVSVYAPVISKKQNQAHQQHRQQHKLSVMELYQKYISSFDGPRCRLSPSCSAYAIGAFNQHGYFMGLILTADRLMHEDDKIHFLKITHAIPWLQDWHIGHHRNDWQRAMFYYQFRPRFKDSLSDNTFWWR